MAKKILIVDDEPDIIRLLASRLKANNYEVVAAHDGVSAMMKVRKDKPDLVILDIKMAAGDCINVCENIKKSVDTMLIPVIFITAFPDEDTKKKVKELKAEDFISKPIDTADLLAKVENALGKDT